ncbi:MAG TPA: tetratricopeptide repeat protein [Candidatus Competibacteraceae bacterium]|nr:tetratricopeptide repeat protein [Candidatus Competibacteraceae bacterium]
MSRAGRLARGGALLLLASVLLSGCDALRTRYNQALWQLLQGHSAAGVAELQALADAGYAPAQFRLGMMYRAGQHLPQDASLALRWIERAARQDQVGAQYWLARFYFEGFGVVSDAAHGVVWLRRLAERGYAPAQFLLSDCYEHGRGVMADPAAALQWRIAAARAGHREAQRTLAEVYRRGGLGQVPDPHQAEYWQRQAELPALF